MNITVPTNNKTSIKFPHYFLFSLVLIALGLLSPCQLQAADQAETNTVIEEEKDDKYSSIKEMAGDLIKLLDVIDDFDEQLKTAEGEDRLSVQLLRKQAYESFIAQARELEIQGEKINADGDNLSEILADYRDQLLDIGTRLRREVEFNNDNLLTRDRDTTTEEGVQNYLLASEEMDESLTMLSEYILIIQNLDFAPQASMSFLEDIVPQRAVYLAGRLNLYGDRIALHQDMLKASPDDEGHKTGLLLSQRLLNADADSLKSVISIGQKLEMDMQSYQTLLVKTTGQLNTDVIDIGVVNTLVREWWLESKNTLRENAVDIFFKAILFVVILFVFWLIAALLAKGLSRGLSSSRMRRSSLLHNMIVAWTYRLVMFMGLLIALAQMGISLGPLLAGLGVAGFIIGFALQETLGNFAAGLMILIYQPYDEGDMIEAAGVQGRVSSMNIVSTTILTIDNQTLIIPNSKIWGDVIRNITAQTMRRIDMVFGIGYGDDIPKAEAILTDIVDKCPRVMEQPEPIVRLHTLGESSVDFVVRPWVKTEDYWEVYWEITREVKLRFDSEGVNIPFPQRDVHLHLAELPEALGRSKVDENIDKPE